MTLMQELETGKGYVLDLKFSSQELIVVTDLVREHWLDTIKHTAPYAYRFFHDLEMYNYHQFDNLLDHRHLWCKKNRILPTHAVELIRATSLVNTLEQYFGKFTISNEEGARKEEIYWRLVRPNQSSDIGPLHADAWFWDLGHGSTPPHCQRVKVWIPLYCEPGLNGLRVVPHSQKKQWNYYGKLRDGLLKPQLYEQERDLAAELIHTEPGESIIFHDQLLHGGALNQGQHTRVSMEFTLFVAR